jgi:hypothetical protein
VIAMVWHLVRDAVRRLLPVSLFFTGFLWIVWLMLTAGVLSPTGALAFSFGTAWFLGINAGMVLFGTRILSLLPVSRRTVWQAQWLVSTVVATAWTTAAKLAAALLGALPTFGSALQFIALSACLDFLYNGVLVAVAAATGVTGGQVQKDRSIITKTVQSTGLFIVMAGFVWGFILRPVIPTGWSHVTGTAAIVMSGACLVAILAFLYSPPINERRPGRVHRAFRRRRDRTQSSRSSRLVGLSRLVADDLAATARMSALMAIAGIFLVLHAFNPFPGVDGPVEALETMGLLPLREDALFGHGALLLVMGLGLVNFRISTRDEPISSLARQLRVQPIGVRQLNALLVGRRLLGWAVVWALFLIPHVIVFQRPPSTLRLDIFLWIAGSDALVYAVLLRWMHWFATAPFAMVFGRFSARILDDAGTGMAPFIGLGFGLMCLIAAFAINHDTLTTRQAPYRRMWVPVWAEKR